MIKFRKRVRRNVAKLSVSSDLLAAARKARLNLSAALVEALEERIAAAKREQWIRENSAAISAYNKFVTEHRVASDGLRNF
jgi:antitoxin CcdA